MLPATQSSPDEVFVTPPPTLLMEEMQRLSEGADESLVGGDGAAGGDGVARFRCLESSEGSDTSCSTSARSSSASGSGSSSSGVSGSSSAGSVVSVLEDVSYHSLVPSVSEDVGCSTGTVTSSETVRADTSGESEAYVVSEPDSSILVVVKKDQSSPAATRTRSKTSQDRTDAM
jgi:hypothetical protein